MNSEGTPAYRPWMTAQEARSLGLHVDADVPDCAVLKPDPDSVTVNVDETDSGKIHVNLSMVWSWVAFTLTLTEEEFRELRITNPDLS